MWSLYYILSMILTAIACDEFASIAIEDDVDIYMAGIPNIYKGDGGSMTYNKNVDILLIFKCADGINMEDIFPPLKEILSVKQIFIHCILPVKPIVETLKKLNINETAVETLIIRSRYIDALPRGNYTENLNIKTLWIDAPYQKYFLRQNYNFMEPLKNLTNLILTGTTLVQLPAEMRLRVLSLKSYNMLPYNNRDHIIPTWNRYCRDLEELSIRSIYFDDVPVEWPKNCSQLSSLRLEGLDIATTKRILSSGIETSCENLQTLDVRGCDIDYLPHKILNVAKGIKKLNLYPNRLIDKDLQNIPFLQNLTYLNLSRNKLSGWVLFEIVEKLPSLRELYLNDNNLAHLFCINETRIRHFTAHTPALEKLSMNGMQMKTDCFKNARFTNLKYLDMSFTGNVSLKLQDLPTTNAKNLEVNLRYRTVEYIDFSVVDYERLLQGNVSGFWGFHQTTNLTVYLSSINCECENYWLALTLRNVSKFVSMPGVLCSNSKKEFIDEPIEHMDCKKYEHAVGCIRRYPETNGIARPKEASIECHDRKTIVWESLLYAYERSPLKITSLNLTDNWIETLKYLPISEALKWIDLRRNTISRLDQNDITKLFANPMLRIWLSQNLFICDCDNAIMLDAFHLHHEQIVDFEELFCIESNRPLKSATTYEVCNYSLKSKIIAGGVFAALVFITGVLLWRYRLQVLIYLYSRGWCLYCLTEDDVDFNRPYDAFLSFSHADEVYVTEELLPKLEREPYSYNICVHYRDWVVGDWIPSQIMRSVTQSKRTIVVLSRNFIESMWGSLEFKYAIASAAKEKKSRLLVLILDDVLSDDLDPELKGYLLYNTYLRCDDPWFWEKLKYAMPR